jgi:hypothetical protein
LAVEADGILVHLMVVSRIFQKPFDQVDLVKLHHELRPRPSLIADADWHFGE